MNCIDNEDIKLNRNYIKDIIILSAVTFLLVALDQALKCYIVRNIQASDPVIVIENFFQITYVLNPGAAFGFLADKGSALRYPFFVTITSVAIVFIIYMFFTLERHYRLTKISLYLILGGAIGNFIDRLRLKAVIDFIYVHYYNHYWPAFNIADVLITVGVILMAIDIIIIHRTPKRGMKCAP